MSRFDFLTKHTVDLEEVDRIGKREFYIDNFIAERSINILYAPGGEGKTWISFALAKYFAENNIDVIYLDTDNGIGLLKDRGFDVMLDLHKNKILYINADTMDNPKEDMQEVLSKLKTNASGDFYKRTVVVMDSLKFFLGGGMYDEAKMYNFFVMCKVIRRCGGTVIALNHALKNQNAMKGGSTITDSSDEVWGFKNVFENAEEIHCVVTPSKNRIGTKEAAYMIKTKTLELLPLDPVIASMHEDEREFVEKVQQALENEELSQSALLKTIGTYGADKTRLGWLEKHESRYWNSAKKGKSRLYKKMPTSITTLQT